MARRRDRLYPYRGRIIRPQPHDSRYGADRTISGHRYVAIVYDSLRFSRRRSENQGERGLFGSGSVADTQFRFQTPAYLPEAATEDELALLEDGKVILYNIVTPAPVVGRPGVGGRLIGGYTVILARRKAAQNAEMDIYV